MVSGRIVFASGRTNDFDIWCLDLDAGSLNQLTVGDSFNTSPRWSPDGRSIVYLCTADDLIPSVWIMDAQGMNRRRVTSGIVCQAPSWSPDGRSILCVTNAEDRDDLNVSSISVDGGAITPIFNRRGLESEPRWSKSGDAVLFSGPPEDGVTEGQRGSPDIFEYRVASQTFHRLTNHPASDRAPCYSPDGGRIAFVSHRRAMSNEEYERRRREILSVAESGDIASINRAIGELKDLDGDADIFVMNRDGSNQRAVTRGDRCDDDVCWSPCGRYLAYTSGNPQQVGSRRLRIVEVESGAPLSFSYDRSKLEIEIGAASRFNTSFFQKLIPNIIERRFAAKSFWGEECCPDWAA